MKTVILAGFLSLSSCGNLTHPATVANTTTADEKAAIGCEALYQGYNLILKNGVDLGKIDKTKAKQLDNQGFGVAASCRSAYKLGNSKDLGSEYSALKDLVGNVTSVVK